MAKATTETVTNVNLTISSQEAQALLQVCQRISGSPDHSARKHMDSIGGALRSAGFTAVQLGESDYPLEGGITGLRFLDFTETLREPKA